ncbi:retron St85 family effector protein [Bdellovibrio sp. BCCA]|uniref:retron St85 family effector protein n=1 Tax=Bdellovibrio sp. BCCA TaxID=3136281 RepID=UPI0030EFFDB1
MFENLATNNTASALLSELKNALCSEKAFLRYNRPFIFVCGGNDKKNGETTIFSVRSKFLAYAATELPDYEIVLAEAAAESADGLNQIRYNNIALFEEILADISDCVIIFPESPGSFAEVGYFAKSEEIRKKTLIVNCGDEQKDSFLNKGPIDLIDRESDFRTKVHIDFKAQVIEFDRVRTRLHERINGSNKSSKKILQKNFKEMDHRHRLHLIYKIIDIFGAISIEDLKEVILHLFGQFEFRELRDYVGILKGIKYVDIYEADGSLVVKNNNAVHPLVELRNIDENVLLLKVKSYYKRIRPQLFQVKEFVL